jgi:hypothetical protein
VWKARVPDGPNLSWGNPPLLRGGGGLIRRQGNHGDYACLRGGIAMLDDDGTGSSTQVPSARCAWIPVATSYHVRL